MDAGQELLRKIRALEDGHAELKREVSKPLPPERPDAGARWFQTSSRRLPPPRAGLSPRHHMMIMQSLGQAVHVLNLQGKILYWNRHAEHLYGYSAAEAVGQGIAKLVIHPGDVTALNSIIGNIFTGKCWRGKFPVRNKSGRRFSIVANATPLYGDDERLMGLICLSDDTRTLQDIIGSFTSGYYDPRT